MTTETCIRTIHEMRRLMAEHGVRNWLTGLSLVKERLLDGDHAGARATYASMQGNGGFSDLYFPGDIPSTRRLDELRSRLWNDLDRDGKNV